VNRNKQSIAIDITTEDGLEAARRLARSCDVFIQGFRPGSLAKKGLGPDALRAENPRLIYASVGGFGQTGPGRGRRGVDAIVQAESGMACVMGDVNHRLAFIDASTGIALAQGILAALFKRERDGVGETIEISLLDTALWLQMLPLAEYSYDGQEPLGPEEYRRIHHPASSTYTVKDGSVYVTISQQKSWEPLCQVIGLPELATDPRFASTEKQQENVDELRAIIQDALSGLDKATVLERAREFGVMAAPILSYAEVVVNPQVVANNSLTTVKTANGIDLTQVRAPYRLESMPEPPMKRAPIVGEHTKDVLSELGFHDAELAAMIASGAIYQAPPV
jgi:crotonobetainyl-CoA:carnitine CoA-transferase CaiB-like acyl-CoA transferase